MIDNTFYANPYLSQKEAVRRALEQRDPALLPPFLGDYVVEIFREDPDLRALWHAVWEEYLQTSDENRRTLLQRIGEEFLWEGPGRPKELSDEQAAQSRRDSSRDSHHRRRVSERVRKLQDMFQKAAKKLLPQGEKGLQKLMEAVDATLKKERQRGKVRQAGADEFEPWAKNSLRALAKQLSA